MVAPIDHRESDGCALERPRRRDSTEAAANDDDVRCARIHDIDGIRNWRVGLLAPQPSAGVTPAPGVYKLVWKP
jgi:hypothetical protein